MSEGTETEVKRPRKLSKSIEGKVLTITEAKTGEVLKFNLDEAHEGVQVNIAMYGLSQKLGDAAAGLEGQEAVDSIKSVWDALVKGEWSTRAPAAPKITKKDITANLANMSEEDQAAAKAMLAKLGIKLG